ncbi:MAG: hypothetical protein AAF869_05410 [Pseudomonadota bacterium]
MVADEEGFPFGLGAREVHEICEAAYGDMAALTGFALALSARRLEAHGAIIWVSQTQFGLEHGWASEVGLAQMRREPRPILRVRAGRADMALWAVEEAIRCSAVSLVIGEVEDLDFTASRRLTLAARRCGAAVLLLMPHSRGGATAAAARWRVGAAPSKANAFDPHALGFPRWRVVLERSRAAPHMAGRAFEVEWNDETLSFALASELAAHPPQPSPQESPAGGSHERTHERACERVCARGNEPVRRTRAG